MTFKKGQSGNPGGKPTYAGKLRARLNEILDELDKDSGETNVDRVIKKLITEALTGNVFAIKEIFDRIDGRPHQSIDMKAEHTVNIAEELERRRRKAGLE